MGVYRRRYAAQRSVSEAAVRKAIAMERITTPPHGMIDPATADSEWVTQTDRAKQRGQRARQMALETAAGTTKAAATKPVPQAALKAVADTLREAGTEPAPGEATGGEVSFLRARMANEVLKAQTAKVRLEKMKAEVIDRATAMVFDLARSERDAWLNWPRRVAANMAAELGVRRIGTKTGLPSRALLKPVRRNARQRVVVILVGWKPAKLLGLTDLH